MLSPKKKQQSPPQRLSSPGLTARVPLPGPPISESAGAWPGDPEAAYTPLPQGGPARRAVLPAGAEAAQPDPPRRGEHLAGRPGGQGPVRRHFLSDTRCFPQPVGDESQARVLHVVGDKPGRPQPRLGDPRLRAGAPGVWDCGQSP